MDGLLSKDVFIMTQAILALAEIEAMKSANYEREQNGFAHAYGEDAFRAVAIEFKIDENSVREFLDLKEE